MINPTSDQIDAAFLALRQAIDHTGYGRWVTDDVLNGLATTVTVAVLNVPSKQIPLVDPKSVIYRKGAK